MRHVQNGEERPVILKTLTRSRLPYCNEVLCLRNSHRSGNSETSEDHVSSFDALGEDEDRRNCDPVLIVEILEEIPQD